MSPCSGRLFVLSGSALSRGPALLWLHFRCHRTAAASCAGILLSSRWCARWCARWRRSNFETISQSALLLLLTDTSVFSGHSVFSRSEPSESLNSLALGPGGMRSAFGQALHFSLELTQGQHVCDQDFKKEKKKSTFCHELCTVGVWNLLTLSVVVPFCNTDICDFNHVQFFMFCFFCCF